jgi:flagellin
VGGGYELAAGSVLSRTAEVANNKDISIRQDWEISFNAGVMTVANGQVPPTSLEVAVGSTVTLNNGAIIKNDGSGQFSIQSGSLTTGTAMELGVNVAAFTVASQSTLAGMSETAVSNVHLVEATNYLIRDTGALNANVTVGNGVNLDHTEVTSLRAGTTLASGSNVSIADNRFIMLDVNGREVRVSWDAASSTMRVGDDVVAAGKSITLGDGSIISNQGTFENPTTGQGVITIEQGKVTLSRDISTGLGNVAGYSIAKDSTLAAGSIVAAGTSFNAGSVVTDAGSPAFSGSVTLAHGGKGVQFSSNTGNTFEANMFETNVGESFTFVFSGYQAASSNLADSLMSQIGANSGQTTFLSISDMRAKALGVDRIDISSKFGAATAIETVNNALQKVSHQRSLLGAMQNRLEHTIKNLNVASENLQAAESRIRDVDMAREVMEFTKNNILQQASQSMLAQANQAPQSVLQLLR